MDWSQERYVRVYTRDTLTWRLLGWEGRTVCVLVMRKLDRSGLLDVGEYDPSDAVAAMIDLPVEITRIGLPRCLERGVFEVHQGVLVMPNFIEAQEAEMTGAQRNREWRARRRDKARANALLSKLSDETSPHDETNRLANGTKSRASETPYLPYLPNRTVPTDQIRPDLKIAPAKKTLWEQWLFDVILPIYPEHRRGAGLAEARAWVNENQPDEALRAKIEASVREWSVCPYWQREDGRFADGVGKFFIGEKWVGHPNQHRKPVKKFVG